MYFIVVLHIKKNVEKLTSTKSHKRKQQQKKLFKQAGNNGQTNQNK